MNKYDLHKLLAIKGSPAISILLPTHRTHPENQQDPIRVRNSASKAKDMLLARWPRREVRHLIEQLDQLERKIDYRYARDGLAIFLHADFSGIYYLPFSVRERVILDETFATRDILFALNRSPRYWTLVLSESPTRLFQGFRKELEQIVEGEFPMYHRGPGGEESLPGGFGIRRSAIRDEYDRKFFRHVDEAFTPYAAADPLPLILVGVDRNLAFFNQVSANTKLLLDTLQGSHDSTSVPELADLVWPLVEQGEARKRQGALQELELAVSNRNFTSGMSAVWRAASQGRGAVLLVERNYHYPARLEPNGLVLTPAEDREGADVIWDAVNELIETVVKKQGRVVFLEDGTLNEYQHVALILRY